MLISATYTGHVLKYNVCTIYTNKLSNVIFFRKISAFYFSMAMQPNCFVIIKAVHSCQLTMTCSKFEQKLLLLGRRQRYDVREIREVSIVE